MTVTAIRQNPLDLSNFTSQPDTPTREFEYYASSVARLLEKGAVGDGETDDNGDNLVSSSELQSYADDVSGALSTLLDVEEASPSTRDIELVTNDTEDAFNRIAGSDGVLTKSDLTQARERLERGAHDPRMLEAIKTLEQYHPRLTAAMGSESFTAREAVFAMMDATRVKAFLSPEFNELRKELDTSGSGNDRTLFSGHDVPNLIPEQGSDDVFSEGDFRSWRL